MAVLENDINDILDILINVSHGAEKTKMQICRDGVALLEDIQSDLLMFSHPDITKHCSGDELKEVLKFVQDIRLSIQLFAVSHPIPKGLDESDLI